MPAQALIGLHKLLKSTLFPYGRPWPRGVWSIGIYHGKSPLELTAPNRIRNPILGSSDVSDLPAVTVADPFMLQMDQTWYMFFEVYNNRTKKGEIGLAISLDASSWSYQQIVLAEPFHLSYPYVFEHQNAIYMIPESHKACSVRLYRARNFPTDWSFVCTLLEGDYFLDPSVVWHKGKWWLFTETGRDDLRLYFADELTGPWREHPRSPVVAGDPHTARPAGRLCSLGDTLIRYAQDAYPTYGRQVRAFEIIELTPDRYKERSVSPDPILKPGQRGWNHLGMHHVDPHQTNDGSWLACVDGRGQEFLQVSVFRRRVQRWLASVITRT